MGSLLRVSTGLLLDVFAGGDSLISRLLSDLKVQTKVDAWFSADGTGLKPVSSLNPFLNSRSLSMHFDLISQADLMLSVQAVQIRRGRKSSSRIYKEIFLTNCTENKLSLTNLDSRAELHFISQTRAIFHREQINQLALSTRQADSAVIFIHFCQ